MLIRMAVPLRGSVEGVELPSDPNTVFELVDHAAEELVARGIAVPAEAEADAEADAEVAEVAEEPEAPAADVEAPVETRVVEAEEKRAPQKRTPKADQE